MGFFLFATAVQTDPEVHPEFCPIGTGCSYPGGRAVGAWSWRLTPICCRS